MGDNITLSHMHKELLTIKRDVELIKNVLAEEGKLTEAAKKKLANARNTPASLYVKLEESD